MTLKELLGEELYSQLTEKLGDKHKVAIVSDGNWIPKDRFDGLNEEKKEYKGQVDELNKKLGELQGQLKDNQTATDTIAQLQEQIQEKEAEMAATRKMTAVKLGIVKSNPKDVSDILPHIKLDAITLGEGDSLAGLDEQITAIKEAKPYLFNEADPTGTGGSKGGGAKDKHTTTKNPWLKDTFNLTEQGRILKDDPELAQTLQAQAKQK